MQRNLVGVLVAIAALALGAGIWSVTQSRSTETTRPEPLDILVSMDESRLKMSSSDSACWKEHIQGERSDATRSILLDCLSALKRQWFADCVAMLDGKYVFPIDRIGHEEISVHLALFVRGTERFDWQRKIPETVTVKCTKFVRVGEDAISQAGKWEWTGTPTK